jgi:hypothetical protein
LFAISLSAPTNLPITVNLVPGPGGANNNLVNVINLNATSAPIRNRLPVWWWPKKPRSL